MKIRYTETGYCTRWGSEVGARRVNGLSKADRSAIAEGIELRLRNAPEYRGETERRIIQVNGHFYCRMPIEGNEK